MPISACSSRSKTAVLTGLSAVLALFCMPAAADDIKVPGTSIVYKTYIEGEGGYDSNPDGLFRKVASPFEKIEGGLRVTAKQPNETYELFLKAREVHFDDLDIENRWDFKVGVDTTFDIGSNQRLAFGTYYLRDFFVIDRAEIGHSYGEYVLKEPDYKIKIEGRSHIEHNLTDTIQGNQSIDDFTVSKSSAFDYSRIDGRISAIGFTKSMVQPFAIFDFGNIDYYNQEPGASINRNSQEEFVVAGLRFDFDKTLRVDVGGRYNHREFDDTFVRPKDNGFVDINAYWQPVEAFKATLVIERYFKEPSTSFGVADDVRTVGLTADWQMDKQWRLSLGGYYDRINAVGDDLRYNKYTATASLTYEVSSSAEIFLSALGKWVDEEFFDDSYNRYKIGSGVRIKF
jgi:hypothetical protein